MTRHVIALPILLSGLLLAGCTSIDPYHRAGMWQPSGANAANLAAMVADPHDLIRGHGVNGGLAKDQVVAVDKVWSGAAKSGTSSGGSSAAAASPGG